MEAKEALKQERPEKKCQIEEERLKRRNAKQLKNEGRRQRRKGKLKQRKQKGNKRQNCSLKSAPKIMQ